MMPDLLKDSDNSTSQPWNTPSTEGSLGKAAADLQNQFSGNSLDQRLQPVGYDPVATQKERYTQSDYYSELGFNPFGNNEQRYGERQTVGNKLYNAFVGGGKLAAQQAIDQFKSWGDTFDSLKGLHNAFQQEDLKDIYLRQQQMSNANPIFQTKSDMDSIMNWSTVANTIQQSGYAVGAVAEILAEEAALTGLTALTFGAAGDVQVVRTVKMADNIAQAVKKTEALSKSFDNTNKLRKVWSTLGKYSPVGGNLLSFAGDFKNLKRADEAVYGAGKLADLKTASRGFGAFYRDFREYNVALSEAKSEAAGTYGGMVDDLTAKFKETYNREPDSLEKQEIEAAALKAGQTNGAVNTALIMVTNRIAFDNALRGFKPIKQLAEDDIMKGVMSVGEKEFEKTGAKLIDISNNPWLQFKNTLLKQPLHAVGYLESNLAEAAQENLQDISNDAVSSYYKAKYNNSDLSWADAVKGAAEKEFSTAGAKTFISGFFTGAVMGAGGKLINAGDKLAKFVTDREAYNQDKQQEGEQRAEFIKNFNESYKDPLTKSYKDRSDNFNTQLNLAGTLKEVALDKDKKTFHDVQSDAKKLFILDALKSKTLDVLTDRLESYTKELTPEEFTKAFGLEYTEENHKQIMSGVNDFISYSKEVANTYDNLKQSLQNPFNPFRFKQDQRNTPEYKKEVYAYAAYQNALEHAVFYKQGFKDTVTRQNQIFKGITDLEGIKDVSYSDLFKMTDPIALEEEIKVLKEEVGALPGSKIKTQKQAKLTELDDYKRLLDNFLDEYSRLKQKSQLPSDLLKYQELEKSYVDQFTKKFKKLINNELLSNQKQPLLEDTANGVISRLLDIYKLHIESKGLLHNVNLLSNPEFFKKFLDRHVDEFIKTQEKEQSLPVDTEEEINGSKTVTFTVNDKDITFNTGDVFVGKLSKSEKQLNNKPVTVFNNDRIKIVDINGDVITVKLNNDSVVDLDGRELAQMSVDEKWVKYETLSPLLKAYLNLRNKVIEYRILAKDENGKLILDSNGHYKTVVVKGRISLNNVKDRLLLKYVDPFTGKIKQTEFNTKYVVKQTDITSLPDDSQKALQTEQERIEANLKDQEFYLNELVTRTQSNLEDVEKLRETNDVELNGIISELEDLKVLLEAAGEDLEKTPYAGRGRKSAKRAELEKFIKEFTEKINQLEARKSVLEQERNKLNESLEDLDKILSIYQDALLEIWDSGEPFDRKGSADLSSALQEQVNSLDKTQTIKSSRYSNEQIEQLIDDTKTEISLLDEGIKYLDNIIQESRNLLSKIAKYEDVYNLLKDIEDKGQLRIQLVKLKKETEDNDKISLINGVLKGLDKGDLGFEAQYVLELFNRIAQSTKEIDNLIGQREVLVPKLNRLKQASQERKNISSLSDRITFLNTIQTGIAGLVKEQVKEKAIQQIEVDSLAANLDYQAEETSNAPETFSYDSSKTVFETVGFGRTAGMHYTPDEKLNEEQGQARFFKFSEQINYTSGKYYLKVVGTKEDDVYNIRYNDTNIKVIVVKKVGDTYLPVGVDGEVLEDGNINKDTLVYTSLLGNEKLLGTDQEALDYVKNHFIVKGLSDAEVLKKVAEYKKFREEIISRPTYLPIISKSLGVPNKVALDVVTGVPQELTVLNRLVQETNDWNNLKHPNGQSIKLMVSTAANKDLTGRVKEGRAVLVREDGSVYRLYTRKLTDREKDNVIEAFKELTGLLGSVTPLSAEQKEHKDFLLKYLKSVIYWGDPSKVKNTDNLFYLKSGYLHRGKIQVKFTPEGIEAGRESLTNDLYHEINNKQLSDNTYYEYEGGKKKEWSNYTEYLLADRANGTAPVYTDIVPYEKDTLQPQLKSVYLIYSYTNEDGKQKFTSPLPEKAIVEPKPGGITLKRGANASLSDKDEKVEVVAELQQAAATTGISLKRGANATLTESTPAANPVLAKIISADYQKEVEEFGTEYRVPTQEIEQLEDFPAFTQWMSKKLPKVSWSKLGHLIDGRALGAFKNGAVYIYENAEIGTGFHEAFHAVWNTYLSDAEQSDLINEFRNRKGNFTNIFSRETKPYSEASLYDVTETLAEEFRDYILNDKEITGTKTKTILQKLWEFIKGLFSAEGEELNSRINSLFKKINTEGFVTSQPVRDLNNLGIQYRAITGTNQINTSYLLEGLNYNFFFNLFKGGKTIDHIINADFSGLIDQSIEELTFRPVQWSLNKYATELGRELTPEEKEQLYSELHKAYPERSSFIELHRNAAGQKRQLKLLFIAQLSKYGINVNDVSEDTISLLENKEESTTDALGIRNALTIDPKKLSSQAVRLLVASLPDDTYRNGKRVVKLNPLGLPVLVNYDKVMNTLINELQGTVPVFRNGKWVDSLTIMFEKLDSKFKEGDKYKEGFVWMERLKMRLKLQDSLGNTIPVSSLQKEDVSLLIGFEKAFSNSKNLPVKTVVEEGLIHHFDPVTDNNYTRIRQEWEHNLREVRPLSNKTRTNIYGVNDEGRIVIDKNSDQYHELISTPSNPPLWVMLENLGHLGIKFTRSADELFPHYATIQKSFFHIVSGIKDGTIKSADNLFSKKIINSKIKELIKIEADSTAEDTTLSHTNASGESQYSVVLPSTATNVLNSLKNVNTLSDFIRSNPQLGYIGSDGSVILNPFQATSLLLKPGGILFDKNGKKKTDLSYHLISGVAPGDASKGTNTAELTYPDRVMQEIYYISKNIYYTPVNSDKSSEFGIGFNKPFIELDDVNNNQKISDIYFDHLQGELDAAIIDHIFPSNVQYYGKNIKNLGFFEDVLGPKLIEKFNKILTQETSGRSDKQADLQKAKEKFLTQNKREILKSFDDYILGLTKETLDGLINLDIIRQVGEDRYKLLGISHEFFQSRSYRETREADSSDPINPENLSKDNVEEYVKFLAVNKEIAVMEMHKLIYGNISLYKDPAKRYNGANASKEAITENKDILTWADTNMKRYDGKIRSVAGPSTFKNISFADNVVVSRELESIAEGLFESLIKDISPKEAESKVGAEFTKEGKFKNLILKNGKATGELKNYINLTEADAQGWVMPDMYRDLMFFSSKLKKGQQDQLNYERAYEVVTRSKKPTNHPAYKKYSDTELNWAKDILKKGNPGQVLQTLKPQYFGYAVNPSLQQTVFLKNSVQPKFYRQVEGTQFEDLYLASQAGQVDIINFESGQKVGNVLNEDGEFLPVYNELGKANVEYNKGFPVLHSKLPQQELYTRYLGIQTEVPDIFKDKVVRGTQVTKLIQSNFKTEGEYSSPEAEALLKEYDSLLKLIIRSGKDKLIKRLGMAKDAGGSYYSKELKNLVHTLRQEAITRGLPDNQIDSIAIESFGDFEQLVYKLDTLPNRDKLDNIINSIFHSAVISEKIHGKPAVQVANTLSEVGPREFVFLKDGKYESISDISVLTPEEKKTVRVVSSDLKFYRKGKKTSNMEVYVPFFFNGITPEQLGLKLENGIYAIPKGFDMRLLESLGFRIPTQGMNSIDSITIKGFLPKEMGDMVIVPSEIVGKAGSDFDIDKLQMYLANYYTKGKEINYVEWKGTEEATREYYSKLYDNGGILSPEQFTELDRIIAEEAIQNEATNAQERLINSAFGELFSEELITRDYLKNLKNADVVKDTIVSKLVRQALQNRYREVMQDIVTLPENYRALITPNGTETLKTAANKILELKGQKDAESSRSSLRRLIPMSDIRERYVSSKRMVGIGALEITSHTMSQLAGIELTGNYNAKNLYYLFPGIKDKKVDIRLKHNNKEGKLYLYAKTDQAKQWISELLNESLSGFVDAAKDPFIFILNINMETAGTWFYLQKLGVPIKDLAYFYAQPIIDEYFKEQIKNKSIFKKASAENETQEDIMFKVASKYLDAVGIKDIYTSIKNLKAQLVEAAGIEDFKQRKRVEKGIRDKMKSLKKPFYEVVSKVKNSTLSTDSLENAIREMNKPSYKLSEQDALSQLGILFDYLEYNTQSRYLGDFRNGMGYDNKKTRTVIENRVQQSAWNKVIDQDVPFIANPEAILDTFLGEMKDQKEDMFNLFESFFVSLDPRVADIFKPALDHINNTNLFMSRDQKGDFINDYQNFFISYILHTTGSLNSYYSTLFGEGSIPVQLKKYRDGNNPVIVNNPLIRELLPLINTDRKKTDNIKLLSRRLDVLEQNVLVESFNDLLDYAKETADTELEEFMNSLAVFAIIQNGVTPGRTSFIKILPTSVYSKLTKTILDNFLEREITLDPDLVWKQFHQNQWWNRDIVPKAHFVYSKNGLSFTLSGGPISKYEFMVRYFPKFPKGSPEWEEYKKAGRSNELFKSTLYQRIGDVGEKVWYKPINKLGSGNLFTEVYLHDNVKSQVESNEWFDENRYSMAVNNIQVEINNKNLQEEENYDFETIYEQSTKTKSLEEFIKEANEFIEATPDLPKEQIIEQLKCL